MKLENKKTEIEQKVEPEEQIEYKISREKEIASNPTQTNKNILYKTSIEQQYQGLSRDFEWFYKYLHFIIGEIDPAEKKYAFELLPEPTENCAYDSFIKKNKITLQERIILLLAIIPNFSPTLLNILKGNNYNRIYYPQLGGVLVGDEKNFWPTVETALFLISEGNLDNRILNENYFLKENRLLEKNWITIEESSGNVPLCYHRLSVTDEFSSIIKGVSFRPDYSSTFPASYLSTTLEWNDLVLPYSTMTEVNELKTWLQHGDTLLQHPELKRKIKPGYRVLFYGPPGTGKTLTASLLGKEFNLDVYRIDLSQLISKWVGETEKNLKKVFDLAENKDWVLFFDEADSIFGKRTQTNTSNDRYANQEVSYLLQRIEDFPGMIILASNLRSNMDEAFNRRFQSIINFPLPDDEIRVSLWEKSFPSDYILDKDISIGEIAKRYELAGGAIINVVRFCVLQALDRDEKIIHMDDITQGIIKENKKHGKIVQ